MNRDLAEVEDLQDICVAHLELDRNAEKVKITYRILGFQRKERDISIPQHLVQIEPWRVDTFTPCVFPAVEHVVEDLDPQM